MAHKRGIFKVKYTGWSYYLREPLRVAVRKEKYSKFNQRAPADCPAWLLAEYRAWSVIQCVHLRVTVSTAVSQIIADKSYVS